MLKELCGTKQPRSPELLAKTLKNFRVLWILQQKKAKLEKEFILALYYELSLAEAGLTTDDVQTIIPGAAICSIHNYKGMRRIHVCVNETWRCRLAGRELSLDRAECAECGNPTAYRELRISPNHAREKMPKHLFGVETKDHRFVWFKEPLHPEPWQAWIAEKE